MRIFDKDQTKNRHIRTTSYSFEFNKEGMNAFYLHFTAIQLADLGEDGEDFDEFEKSLEREYIAQGDYDALG